MPPYLSIVIFSRNDDYGGDLIRKLNLTITCLLEQLEKYYLDSELILVDWNPPNQKLPLKDVIDCHHSFIYCTVKTIEVPFEYHKRFKYYDKRPVNGAAAFNTGIRRARGQFILPGVSDAIYSNELVSFISEKKLKEDVRYRVNRLDVDRIVLQSQTSDELLLRCNSSVIREHKKIEDPQIIKLGIPALHTNACGDFQLMSRKFWHKLRGFREVDVASQHVDGLLSYASFAAGVKEELLNKPLVLYKIDHPNMNNKRIKEFRSGFEEFVSHHLPPSINRRLLSLYHKFFGDTNKYEVYGIPIPSIEDFYKLCKDVIAGKRSFIFNDENWGLGQTRLSEHIINRGNWDK